MHEWALAESVSASIQKELDRHEGAQLQRINLVFGELQNVDSDIFRTGLEAMLEELPEATRTLPIETIIHIETEAARFRCNPCGEEWGLDAHHGLTDDEREAIHFLPEAAHAFLECPHCGSRDYKVVQGRGVTLASIELVEPDQSE